MERRIGCQSKHVLLKNNQLKTIVLFLVYVLANLTYLFLQVRGADGLPIPCFLLANKCDLLEDEHPNRHFQTKQHNRVCQNYGFGGKTQSNSNNFNTQYVQLD